MKRFWSGLFAIVFLLIAPVPALADGGGDEHHEEELAEPLFTGKSFLESEIEVEAGFDDKETESETEIGLGASWVFLDRLQLGVELPIGIRNPDAGDTEHSIADIEFSAKYLVYKAPKNRLILSLGAEVAAPTGDEKKEIGSTGEWALFIFAGTAVPLPGLPDLGIHLQFGWEQQIRLTDEQKEEAEELGVGRIREKEVIWRLAFNMKLLDGVLSPSFELLGKTIVDAIEAEEKGTIVEIGGGFWLVPFGERSALGPLAFGAGAKGPVTDRKESNYSMLFIAKYEIPR